MYVHVLHSIPAFISSMLVRLTILQREQFRVIFKGMKYVLINTQGSVLAFQKVCNFWIETKYHLEIHDQVASLQRIIIIYELSSKSDVRPSS